VTAHPPRGANPLAPVARAIQAAGSAVSDFVASPGRRNVRIFGLSDARMMIAATLIVCVGIPLAAFIAVLPFWDAVGEWSLIRRINAFIAPGIDALPYQYHPASAPRLPGKRFLIAVTSLVEIVLLANFVALSFRAVRRHALLVWICYDRRKIFEYFGVSALVFCVLWYILFFDWSFVRFLGDTSSRGRVMIWVVAAVPFVTIAVGHMAAIVALGALRDSTRQLRRFRRALQ
jgi:uncharacterized membrane protein SirB2